MELTSEQQRIFDTAVDRLNTLSVALLSDDDKSEPAYWDTVGAALNRFKASFREMSPFSFGLDDYEGGPLTDGAIFERMGDDPEYHPISLVDFNSYGL